MGSCSSCSKTACACGPSTLPSGCPPGRGPGFPPVQPGNQPVELGALACSPALARQAGIDFARRQVHLLGQRPYRVSLIWQRQDDIEGRWVEDGRLELMPVDVRGMDAIERVVEQAGDKPDGQIELREVSPLQVDEATMRGYRNGQPWGQDSAAEEFFFEVQAYALCPGDLEPRRYRFTMASTPQLRMDRNEWQVELTTQFGHRSRAGGDQTVPDDDGFEAAVLLA